MEYSQILERDLQPGGLVEWVPRVAGGLGSWRRDPRPTSHNHEQHLWSAFMHHAQTHREGGRESWLGLVLEFSEPMSVPAVRAMISAWIDRHEVLRSHVVLTGKGPARLSTDPGTVELNMNRIGWYRESGPLTDQVASSFDRATAPLHWPAYRFATIARDDGFTLLFAADHSLVDGYSLIAAQYELRELYRAACAQQADGTGGPDDLAATLPPVGSYPDFSGQERLAADAATADHVAAVAWRRFLHEHGRMPRFTPGPAVGEDAPAPGTSPAPGKDAQAPGKDARAPGETARTRKNGPATPPPQESFTTVVLDREQTRAFEARCTRDGVTLPAGLFGALALAYHDLYPDAPAFACAMPRHTRNREAWATALGWFVGLAPLRIRVDDNPGFPTAAQRAQETLALSRDAARLPMRRVAEILDVDSAATFVVSYLDTTALPGAEAADAGGARVIRSHAYPTDEVYVWLNRTPAGIRLHARFPAGPAGDPVRTFLDGLARLLVRMSRTE